MREPSPTPEYTPHGYLANPYAVARSWSEGEGGCLRSSRDYVGFGWQLPWALHARASAELAIVLAAEDGSRRLVMRADYADTGIVGGVHTARQFSYRWRAFGRVWEATFVLVARGELGLRLTWETTAEVSLPAGRGCPSPPAPLSLPRERGSPLGSAGFSPIVLVGIGLIGARMRGPRDTEPPPQPTAARISEDRARIDLGAPYGTYEVLLDADTPRSVDDAGLAAALERDAGTRRASVTLAVRAEAGSGPLVALLRTPSAPDTTESSPAHPIGLPLSLGRKRGAGGEGRPTVSLAPRVLRALDDAAREDRAFADAGLRLAGDWPASWVRGWTYDVETTRMCVFPAGGIFTDVWPSWMIQWPRAVVAEGTLDMARLAYADPSLALRATLSLFRDATAPNVPCVFQHGEPNMVASDGSICGTSPAWCIPFYNLERLYALTLDGAWLAAIYPYLARYLGWWLAERTDADGWAVYKCTWEAGEDDTPRLDPERRGDNVVSDYVRPVELQATMAHAAGVLARFADILDEQSDAARWRGVEAEFLTRTRSLWDAAEGRFRDWDRRAGTFLAPATNEPNYWGIDPCRFSALAFTPVLAGLADAPYRAGLVAELGHYDGPPWTLWASWSYAVLEAAHALGERAYAGRVAAEIVGRVYAELDAREIAGPNHPTPGVAREFWPLDLSTWASCEGYGWGANTASLLMRQVFGFFEGPYTDVPPLTPRPPLPQAGEGEDVPDSQEVAFRLAPSLPGDFLVAGKVYGVYGLPYRGRRVSIVYHVGGPNADRSALRIMVRAGTQPTACRVLDDAGRPVYESPEPRASHEFPAMNGGAYSVTLTTSAPAP